MSILAAVIVFVEYRQIWWQDLKYVVICPMAIAYSIGHIIKLNCVSQCVCVCSSVSSLTVAILD